MKEALGGMGLGGLLGFGGAAGVAAAATAITYRRLQEGLGRLIQMGDEYGQRWAYAVEVTRQAKREVSEVENALGRSSFLVQTGLNAGMVTFTSGLNSMVAGSMSYMQTVADAISVLPGMGGVGATVRNALKAPAMLEQLGKAKPGINGMPRVEGAYGITSDRARALLGGVESTAMATDERRKMLLEAVATFQSSGGKGRANDEAIIAILRKQGLTGSEIEFARRAGDELRRGVTTTNDILRRIEAKIGRGATYAGN